MLPDGDLFSYSGEPVTHWRHLRPDDAGAYRLHAVENPVRPVRDGRSDSEPRRILRFERLLIYDRCGLRHFGWPALNAATQQRRQRLIGIALMCGAVALFACLDTTAKYLNTQMDSLQIAWARYTSAFVLTLIVSNPLTHPGLLRTRSPKLQITRSLLLVGSTALNFLALRWLQLDEALSIIFTFPFLVAIISGPILGEWFGWRRWAAIGFGFVGVLLITRPGLGGMHPAAFITLGATICYSLYAVITRIVSRVDSNQTSLFYANFIGALVMLPVIPFVW